MYGMTSNDCKALHGQQSSLHFVLTDTQLQKHFDTAYFQTPFSVHVPSFLIPCILVQELNDWVLFQKQNNTNVWLHKTNNYRLY